MHDNLSDDLGWEVGCNGSFKQDDGSVGCQLSELGRTEPSRLTRLVSPQLEIAEEILTRLSPFHLV